MCVYRERARLLYECHSILHWPFRPARREEREDRRWLYTTRDDLSSLHSGESAGLYRRYFICPSATGLVWLFVDSECRRVLLVAVSDGNVECLLRRRRTAILVLIVQGAFQSRYKEEDIGKNFLLLAVFR